MPGDPGSFISGALRHEDVDVAREYGTAMCTLWSLVNVGNRTLQSRGSGFLVRCAGQACVLTNAHVLPNREALERSSVNFIVPVSGCSSEVTLCPEKFFMTSPKPRPDACACKFEICTCPVAAKASPLALDYTVCGIKAEGLHLRTSVPVPFNGTKPLPGNGIYFVHQIGEHLKCSKEQIEVADEFRILSMSASFPGSSGSPVFNLDRELIGLHRAGGCKANISVGVSRAGIGKVIAPCLAVPTRAIARNMRLQMTIRDILDDILYSFLEDGEESEGSAGDRESSSEDEKEIAHYAPLNNAIPPPKQPRYLLSKWGFEIFYEKSKAAGGQITVTRLIPDTQAAERLEVGDIIHSVDGVAISDMEMVLILTYLQLPKLLLAVDRLSPSSGFLMLLTNRRRLQVVLDTPQLSHAGTVHSSSEDPRAHAPSLPAVMPSTGEVVGVLGVINTEEMLQDAVKGAASLFHIPLADGSQASEPRAAGETAASEQGGAAVVDALAVESEVVPGEGKTREPGTEAGSDEASEGLVVVDGFGGPRYVVERLGLQLGRGEPGRLRVAKVGKQSWCRPLLRRGDELLSIGGRSLRGMPLARALELLQRDGVRCMLARAPPEGPEAAPEQRAEEVWTVELCAPAPDAEPHEGGVRTCRKQRRRGHQRARELTWPRPGQAPAVSLADEHTAGGSAGADATGWGAGEDGKHAIKRWGLELGKGQPGRLRVSVVRDDSLARGRVQEGDEIIAVNRRSLKGMKVSDVLEAMSVGVLLLALERKGKGVVVELHALKLAALHQHQHQQQQQQQQQQLASHRRTSTGSPDPAPEPELERPTGMIFAGAIGDIIERATTDTARATAAKAAKTAVPAPPPAQRIAVERWGLELERGAQPGRLRVCGMGKESRAHGKLCVGDVLTEVNGRGLKGMTVAEVLAMLEWERPVVELERAVKRAALVDYWQIEQLTLRLGPPEVQKVLGFAKARDFAPELKEAVEQVLQGLVDAVASEVALTYPVRRWGLELGRGGPGRLRVVRTAAEGVARRHLRAGDEVMALDGRGLKGMRVAQVLALLDRARVVVLVHRKRGALPHEALRVELVDDARKEQAPRPARAEQGGGAGAGALQAGAGGVRGAGGGACRSGQGDAQAGFCFAEGMQALRKPPDEPRGAEDAVAGAAEEELELDAAVFARELLGELARVAATMAQRRAGVSGEVKAGRWGLEMGRGVPGRLKVVGVRGSESLAFGKVWEADEVLEVNGQSVKGMKLAEVLAMLALPRVSLRVQRAVGGRGADYWQPWEARVELVDRAAEAAARAQALRAAEDVLEMLLEQALHEHNRRIPVERWGVVLKRGTRGRLGVTLVREGGLAVGRLEEGDEIVAIQGTALGSMHVQAALRRLEEDEIVQLTVERATAAAPRGPDAASRSLARVAVDVELQAYAHRFKANPGRVLASAIEGMCNVRGAAAPRGVAVMTGTPEGVKHGVDRWGMVLGKGSPGCLKVISISPESLVHGRIREGDSIVAVDGKGFRGMKMARVLELLRREESVVRVVRVDGERQQTLRVVLSAAPPTSAPSDAVLVEADTGPPFEPPQRRVRESERAAVVVGEIIGGVLDHAESIASTRGAKGPPPTLHHREEGFRVDKWGLLFSRGGPGRVKVLKVGKDSAAGGVLQEGDMVVMLNGKGVQGKTIADVLEMMQAQPLRVVVDRHTGGRWALETLHLDAPRPRRTAFRVHPTSLHPDAAAPEARLSAGPLSRQEHWVAEQMRSDVPRCIARDLVAEIVEGVVLTHKVGRWGVELRRASPGKLKVCEVKQDALAFGRLHEGDVIVAVNSRELKGMKVCEVLDALDNERVFVTVERVESGARQPEVRTVELRSLQSITALVKLSIDTINAINKPRKVEEQRMANEEREKLDAVAFVLEDMVDAAVIRHSVRLWGMQLRRGNPGRLTVSRVEPGGLAAEQLAVGDEIVSVNGTAMKGITVSEAMSLLGNKELVLTVERRSDSGVLHAIINLKVPPSHAETRETREGSKAISEISSNAVSGFFDGIVQRFSETTAQFAAAAAPPSANTAAAPKSDEMDDDASEAESAAEDSAEHEQDVRAAPPSYFGEGLQLLRSSPGMLTVKKLPNCSGWDDLVDGDEIVAINGVALNGVKTSQVRGAMMSEGPTLTVHRRILNPPGTTFWKWMLPAQVVTVRLPAVEAVEAE